MTLPQLEQHFKTIKLPETLQLTPHEKITNVRNCIDSHIQILKYNSGKKSFMPYWDRLVRIKELLE